MAHFHRRFLHHSLRLPRRFPFISSLLSLTHSQRVSHVRGGHAGQHSAQFPAGLDLADGGAHRTRVRHHLPLPHHLLRRAHQSALHFLLHARVSFAGAAVRVGDDDDDDGNDVQNGRRSARVHGDDRDSADEGGGGDRIERVALRIVDHVRDSRNDVFDVREAAGSEV